MLHVRVEPVCRTIADSSAVAELLGPTFAGLGHEELRVIHLDAQFRMMRIAIAPAGGASAVDLPIRAIVRDALELGSSMLILAHNHPAGDPTPSRMDIMASRHLADVTRPLSIHMIDHLIFTTGRWISFRALGLL